MRKLFSHWRTYVLVGIQYVVAVLIYVVLAETGKIRYDSLAVAIVIGFAPSQVLRVKLFETRGGKDVGIVAIYDRILRWLNDGMMITKYKDLETKIEIIAHYNSEQRMVSELHSIFSHARSATQERRLLDALLTRLKEEPRSWERRLICARELLRRLGWRELHKRRLVPEGLKEDESLDGPIGWIRESRHFLLRHDDRLNKLEMVIESELQRYGKRTRDYYNRKVGEVDTEEDRIFSRVRFLVLNLGYDRDRLRQADLLPSGDDGDAGDMLMTEPESGSGSTPQ